MIGPIIRDYVSLYSGLNYPDFKVMTKMFNMDISEILDELYSFKKEKISDKTITRYYKHKNRKLKLRIKKENDEWSLVIKNKKGEEIVTQGNRWFFFLDDLDFPSIRVLPQTMVLDLVQVHAMDAPSALSVSMWTHFVPEITLPILDYPTIIKDGGNN